MDTFEATSAEGTNTDSATSTEQKRFVDHATTRLGEAAGEVIQQAKSKGASLATAASGSAKDLLGQRIAAGGEWVGHLAESTKCAADHLEDTSPEFAGLVRQASETIEDLSLQLQTRSVDELVQTATDFARRRPEVVFGISALFAFAAFRVLAGGAARATRT